MLRSLHPIEVVSIIAKKKKRRRSVTDTVASPGFVARRGKAGN